jgi:hypothetical protein
VRPRAGGLDGVISTNPSFRSVVRSVAANGNRSAVRPLESLNLPSVSRILKVTKTSFKARSSEIGGDAGMRDTGELVINPT